MNVFVIANATVLRALELAGKRLVGNMHRYQFSVPAYEYHTQMKVNGKEHAAKLLNGAWDHLSVLAEQVDPTIDSEKLRRALDTYCTTLLVREKPHHVQWLKMYLEESGFLHGPE